MRIYAEWIPKQGSYRLFIPEIPQNTIAFVDNLEEGKGFGYRSLSTGIAVCDADTINHIEKTEPESVRSFVVLEKATNCKTNKEMKAYLETIPREEYMSRFFEEPEEYINYFDQVLNHQEWKNDLSKPEQYYLEAFENVLRSHEELYSPIRLPLHDEIPFLDREAVKLMAKKHASLSEAAIASAVIDYSPYTIIFHDNSYGLNMAAEIKKQNVR